jgi:hypothetical protein
MTVPRLPSDVNPELTLRRCDDRNRLATRPVAPYVTLARLRARETLDMIAAAL